MDSLITAAARALAAGDLFGVLNRVALRNDAPALALRGMAMARLGDFAKARALLKNAARAFGPREAVARARCVVAEAEIALVSRDLRWPAQRAGTPRATRSRRTATHPMPRTRAISTYAACCCSADWTRPSTRWSELIAVVATAPVCAPRTN